MDAARSISRRLDQCMIADAQRIARSLRRIEAERHGREPVSAVVARLEREVEESIARRRRRAAAVPIPSYPAELPVSAMRERIKSAILEHQVVVLCGETGSGKTTQLPKICLEVGRGVAGMIGHTQPRRIAARSVAVRIAQELGVAVGGVVGSKVRFGDRTGPGTCVKVMTDGILLAETQADRYLWTYDTIIIDEAHERSLNIDFLLGYLRQLLPRRPDLKVIVTSATIDPERFARHFAAPVPGGAPAGSGHPAPVVMVPGRTYPVEVVYAPPASGDEEHESAPDLESAILGAVDQAAGMGSGDVLVFLPGEREIRETAEALRRHHPPDVQVLPLYARLSPDEQMRIFEPHGRRRIVLATNVAETSLTVPGIRYVVDTGLARIKRFNPRTKVTRLPIEAISRASADQRKGRAGRLGPGVCFRLYAQDDFAQRPEFTEPEILRTNLASVILQMKALRLGRIEEFPFVEPPDGRSVRSGYDTLAELGAIDDQERLTTLGAEMARLPIDPRLGRMLLAADKEGCLAEMLVIASALSVQDPRDRPFEQAAAADQSHRRFSDGESDFVTLLNLWSWFQEHKRHLSHGKLRRLCRAGFVSYLRMREWEEVHRQLHELMAQMGYACGVFRGMWNGKYGRDEEMAAKAGVLPTRNDTIEAQTRHATLHRAVLAGMLGNVAKKAEDASYVGTRGAGGGGSGASPNSGSFSIWPGSALFRRGPRWIVAAELVQTSRLYARTVAKIQPEWIEQVGAHLVRRHHAEPHWDREHATVMAYERVTLWGLEIVARRRIHYGPIDPRHSREIFIHHALVEGDAEHHGAYFEHNRGVIEQAAAIEAKARKHGLIADAQARFAFYDRRLPPGIFSMAAFEKWRRGAERADPRLLFMSRADAVVEDDPRITPQAYPDVLPVVAPGTDPNARSQDRPAAPPVAEVPLTYVYDPGAADDGVTVTVPLHAIGGLSPSRCEWLVPGMLRDKVIALVRLLPKNLRHPIQSVPEFADECLRNLAFANRPLDAVLSEELGRRIGALVPPGAWKFDELPPHLRLNVCVVDDRGEEVARGRDPDDLRRKLTPLADERFAEFARDRFDRDDLTDWTFGDLPARMELERFGVHLSGHPAIIERGDTVSIRLLRSEAEALHRTRAGLRRLYWRKARPEIRSAMKAIPSIESLGVVYAPLGGSAEFRDQFELLVAERAFMKDPWIVRDAGTFQRQLDEGTASIYRAGESVAEEVAEILSCWHAASVALERRMPEAWAESAADARLHLALLTDRGFLAATPRAWRGHLPRFLAGVRSRLDKLANAGLDRDRRAMAQMRHLWINYLTRAKHHHDRGLYDPALEEHRYLLEELRVSLFAQELRTSVAVSIKRLEEHWERVVAADKDPVRT